MSRPPLIDVAALADPSALQTQKMDAARAIDAAAREWGFFYAEHHGVDAALIERAVSLARAFFARDETKKMRIPMSAGGLAWRGYFPAGGELTSGRPDWKEGLYLGSELGPDHPRVRAGVILHGPNLWPPDMPGFRETVLAYLDAMSALGQALMRGCALGLGLPEHWFAEHGTADPLLLLRFFNYPSQPAPANLPVQWGVGEHTDYGLLTLLWQDDVGGLQVRTDSGGWADAPPIPGTFVCNVGDMLDRMTGGRWRSVPHRVTVNTSGRDRLSIPLFFDPDFDTPIQPVPHAGPGHDDSGRRWDGANLQSFQGTYGQYVTAKIGKVFPQLRESLRET
ncbi:MAG TPA: 2-oxoglutarate and iron-dependent oxygenase domain-containing protein [Tepidisphaeraceae bacterium]